MYAVAFTPRSFLNLFTYPCVPPLNLLLEIMDKLSNNIVEILPASVDEAISLAWKLPQDYASWWMTGYESNPAQRILETSLILALIFLAFKRPRTKRAESKLTPKEANELLEQWTPEPLVNLEATASMGSKHTEPEVVLAKKLGATVVTDDGQKLLDFCTFDFLGLTCDQDVKAACVKVLDTVGCGSCGPRGFYGTLDQHLELESKIAEFMGVGEAIMYSDAASTAASVIPAFAKRSDLVFVDDACYDAILTGVMLARCKAIYFKHNDMADLAAKLEEVAAQDRRNGTSPSTQRRFIVVEGVYRNVGDIVPLGEVVELKEKYNCRLILDESFSFGVLGDSGKGVTEHFGIPVEKVEILCGALCASVGSVGGFCIGNEREVVDHQRLQGAGYVFSASAPPFVASAATVGLTKLVKNPGLAQAVSDNALQLWAGLESCPHLLVTSAPESPVTHFGIHKSLSSKLAIDEERELLDDVVHQLRQNHQLFAVASKYMPHHLHKESARRPDVKGPAEPGASVRLCVSALHTSDQIKAVIGAVKSTTLEVFTKRFGRGSLSKLSKAKKTPSRPAKKSTAKKSRQRSRTPARK